MGFPWDFHGISMGFPDFYVHRGNARRPLRQCPRQRGATWSLPDGHPSAAARQRRWRRLPRRSRRWDAPWCPPNGGRKGTQQPNNPTTNIWALILFLLGKCWFEVILRDVSAHILRIRILGTHAASCLTLHYSLLMSSLGKPQAVTFATNDTAKPQSPTQSWREMGTTRGKSSLNEPDQLAKICIVLHSEWTSMVWELYPNTTHSYMHMHIYYTICIIYIVMFT